MALRPIFIEQHHLVPAVPAPRREVRTGWAGQAEVQAHLVYLAMI